ncbi:MAG TPA: pyridoxamine 5'-phosphate oxidase family protein [Acidobacteriaceae bacterium]|nr:pyridoxamine 5'-phosphate oxidase family protein [Acidobacteriaceae bacterium]
MGKHFACIEPGHRAFIEQQYIFFTASAGPAGRVNISPKDRASLRILGTNRVAWLDVTGSGNETAAHLRLNGRLTLMFCAFEGAPMILRLYGRGHVLARGSDEYMALLKTVFDRKERAGARQIIVLDVESVATSCGYGVPRFDYVEERDTLTRWAEAKGEEGLREYRRRKNAVSIDGFPTGIPESEESSFG